MTMYTEDVNFRMRAVFLIVASLSVALTIALREALPAYPRMVAPVSLTLFLGIFWLYDGFLWKIPGFRLLNFGSPPDLSGEWQGNLVRIVDGREVPIAVHLKIRQTWSKLLLVLRTSEASSRNVLVGFTLRNPEAILITWIYEIDDQHADSVLDNGRGVIEMTLHRVSVGHSMKGASMTGKFIESRPGEPLQVEFKKPGPLYWNPKPL